MVTLSTKSKGIRCTICGSLRARNGKPFTPRTLKAHEGQCSKANSLDGLTRRQRQVVALIIDGLSEREISRRLKLSYHTVHFHVRKAYLKLRVRRRAELAAKCFMAGRDSGHVLEKRSNTKHSEGDPIALRYCPSCGCDLTPISTRGLLGKGGVP